ncbi:thymic stromal cotransporter homolog [Tigriopus californicus]|nr:thymic stromal cotransporter homolog [Tigriopus californicus]XP_059094312.1 thymic stromal cotransporter homolog [Tigriopus californicus]XP_059094313.1 thymic stromal cotransporter homolog [Tigriopus californicus]|eukprot:TCALIF_03648-PA protein Name:"Similar to slc46a1 Proton-coupled folate transporter (Xenopus laevis)" AED:0.34 eAED:0.34 QI:0/-1/0/1/-1/1/1/0/468
MSRLSRYLNWITVEPVEFLYCLMFTTSNVVRDNLFSEKVCLLDCGFSEDICYNLIHHNDDINATVKTCVQTRVAELELWDGIIVTLPSVFFCLFVGNWSDYHGRKVLMIMPFLGNIMGYVAYILNYAFFDDWGTNHLLWGSLNGAFGGYQCFNMGLYGYVSDVTSVEARTTRLSILNGVFSLGYVIGTSLGGVLFSQVGDFYVIFGISIILAVCGILYTVFIVPESVNATQEERDNHHFIDWKNVLESLRTVSKVREGSGRTKISLLVLNFMVFMFCLNTNRYDFLLVQNEYDWTIVEFSSYLSVQRICRLLGLFILLPLLSRVLKIDDALIASLSTVVTIVAYGLIAFGNDTWTGPTGTWIPGWVLYLSAALQFNSMITVILRSQCTKAVDVSEIGRIFSVVAFGQAIVPLISNPLFSLIYQNTLNSFPGAYLLVVDLLLLCALFSSLYLWWDSYQSRRTLILVDSQ